MPHTMQPPLSSKILVVDDIESNRLLVEETMYAEGYEVFTAASGDEALVHFEEHRPDLVLLDVRMPGLDGFATCTRLRAMDGGPETPIIFLTALRDLETFDRASRLGADDFLTKPIRTAELCARVETLLRLRRLNLDMREHFRVIRKQRDDLVRLHLQKEQLIGFILHDLKNPVSAIEMYASMLVQDHELSEGSRETVTWILSESQRLKTLLLNLLDIGKADDGKLEPRREIVDLEALVREVARAVRVRADEREQRMVVNVCIDPQVMRADSDLLRRVFENLLDNALRHAPRAGTITIDARSIEGPAVLVRITDTGPGIPEGIRQRIFDRYVQVEDPQANATRMGRGLGLAFCRLAVEAHGGAIWLDEQAPHTVFCIRLPYGD